MQYPKINQANPGMSDDTIRELCLNRFDFFVAFVLKYEVAPFHVQMMEHRIGVRNESGLYDHAGRRMNSMILAPRGGGKCLRGDAKVTLGDGTRKTIKELHESNYIGVVQSVDENYKIVNRKVMGSIKNPPKPLVQLELRSGKNIALTPDHPLLTIDGFKPLSELGVGSRIAAPRKLLSAQTNMASERINAEMAVLGYGIGDGQMDTGLRFTQIGDEEIIDDFKKQVGIFGWSIKEDRPRGIYHVNGKNHAGEYAINWMRAMGMDKRTSYTMFIPERCFALGDEPLGHLIGAMYNSDGSVFYDGRRFGLEYSSVSERLVKDLQHGLLILGIHSRIEVRWTTCNKKPFMSFRLLVTCQENVFRFAEKVRLVGAKAERLFEACLDVISKDSVENANVDTIPPEWRKYINKTAHQIRKLGLRIDNHYSTTRDKLSRVAKLDSNAFLEKLAGSDLFWDEIIGVHQLDPAETYDLQIDGTENFIANDIVVHNSTVMDTSWVLWRMLLNPNLRICIASKTGDQAKSFLGQIKAHIENNQDFIRLFGNLKSNVVWNQDEIVISTRSKILKEPTITALGAGAGVPGRHFDLILCDDIVDDDNSVTEYQRALIKRWVFVTLLPTLEPKGEFHILGTRWHPDDIYGQLAKKDKLGRCANKRIGPNTLVIPAITKDPETGEEKSFWPTYFTIEELKEKREDMGITLFNLAYQNDAAITEGGIMKIENLEPYVWYAEGPAGVLAGANGQCPPRTDLMIFQGVDPALSKKQTADYFSHCTIGVSRLDYHIYVLEQFKGRLNFNEQIDYIIDKWHFWGAHKVGIESNFYQQALGQAIAGKTPWFPIHEVRQRVDKTQRATVLSAFTERHEIHCHYGMIELMETLVAMPNVKNDDIFDSLDIAVETAKTSILSKTLVTRIKAIHKRH